MTALGVRLFEAPGAPPGGAVRIRIPSSQHRSMRPGRHCSIWQRGALGDIHLSGDIRTTRLAYHPDRPRVRLPVAARQGRETAIPVGSDGERAAMRSGTLPVAGDPTPWKDPS